MLFKRCSAVRCEGPFLRNPPGGKALLEAGGFFIKRKQTQTPAFDFRGEGIWGEGGLEVTWVPSQKPAQEWPAIAREPKKALKKCVS